MPSEGTRQRRRLKQPWRTNLLAALAEGHRLTAACALAHVSPQTVATHRAQDPSLDAAIKGALGPLDGRRGAAPSGTSWHSAFLEELERCGSIPKAAERVDISRATAYTHRDTIPAFGAQVQEKLDLWAAAETKRWQTVGQKIADLVADGMSLTRALAECGISGTAWSNRRHMDPALDRQIEKARKARSAKRRQQRQQLPRSWEEPFLAALAEGSHIQAACKAAGVHFVNLYRERRENPEFEAKVRQALSDSGRGFDGEARRMLLIRLNRGADFDDALASTGATRQQVEEAYAANPRLLKKLRPYLSGSGHGKAHRAQKLKCGCLRCRDYRNKAEQKRRARRRLERFPPQARQAFLDLVHNGVRVVDAAQQVGVPWQTVYTVASEDAEFGERLDAATRAHCTCGGTGRTGQGRQRCECPESRQTHAQETRRLRSAGAKQ